MPVNQDTHPEQNLRVSPSPPCAKFVPDLQPDPDPRPSREANKKMLHELSLRVNRFQRFSTWRG
jgi:hypothetical protein